MPGLRYWLITLMLAVGISGPGWAAESFRIERINWGESPLLSPERLTEYSGLQEGAMLDREALADAVRALSRVPGVRNVSIRTEITKTGGVIVHVSLSRVERLARVVVEGARSMGSERVARAMRLNPGDEVDGESLLRATANIEEVYASKGFFDATVTVEIAPPTAGILPGRVTLVVRIDEGKRGKIGSIHFPGFPGKEGEPDGVVTGVRVASRVGRSFDVVRLTKDIARIKKYLLKRGYLHPQVGPYRLFSEGEQVTVLVPVRVRERVVVSVDGNRRVSTGQVLDILNFQGQRTLDGAVVLDARSRLSTYLHDSGYRDAIVDIEMKRDADPDNPVYSVQVQIREGKRHRIAAVRFEGNQTYSDEELYRVIKPGWRLRQEPVREQIIHERAKTIEGVLRAVGFPEATVTDTLSIVPGKKARVTVTYYVDEGRRWWFESTDVQGIEELDAEVREKLFRIAGKLNGTIYRRDRIRSTRAEMTTLLGEFGYIDATLETESSRQERWTGRVGKGGRPHREVFENVVFRVTPGPQVHIGEVRVEGTFRTRPFVIQREIIFSEGDLYTPAALSETRRRIYQVAAFDQVRVRPRNPAETGPRRDVTIQIVEGKPGSVDMGIGFAEVDGIRGLLDVSYRDMFRRGHRAGIRLRAGQLRRSGTISYTLPWVGPYRANLRMRLLMEREDLVSYDRETTAAEVGIRRALSRNVVLNVTYRLERNRFPRLPPDITPIDERQRINVGSILTSLIRDTRDNPFAPRRGTILGASYEQGARALASQVQFGKAIAQVAGFHAVRRSVVVAAKVQGGRAQRLFKSPDVPISERFFVGGQTTIRGYSLDSVGVPGETLTSTGAPDGGDVMLLGNFEVRMGGREGLGLVLFVDAGNVWNQVSTIGVSDFRVGAGPGLHYGTPIGPIRLDLGYKVDRRKNEEPYRVHFTIGHTF